MSQSQPQGDHLEKRTEHFESDEKKLRREMSQRMTRLESRIVQLGEHVGANLRTRMRIEVVQPRSAGRPTFEIDALDVSISRIVAVLRDMCIEECDRRVPEEQAGLDRLSSNA